MFVERCFDTSDKGMEGQMMDSSMMGMGCGCAPVMECPVERVCHRNICYEVPHYIPVNTRIVNHHIYTHTYTPQYTCSEENEKCDVYQGGCNNF